MYFQSHHCHYIHPHCVQALLPLEAVKHLHLALHLKLHLDQALWLYPLGQERLFGRIHRQDSVQDLLRKLLHSPLLSPQIVHQTLRRHFF